MRVRLSVFVVVLTMLLSGAATCQSANEVVPPSVAQSRPDPGACHNFVIREVTFEGSGLSTFQEQNQVAASLIGSCYGENTKSEIEERIRFAFQRIGFFKVRVLGLTLSAPDNASPPTVSITARVDEGARYRLKEITFTGNKAISNATALRRQFPAEDGEIFNRESIAKGLENLREAYSDLGYINFTAVPNTQIDEDTKLISLNMDLDEGRQFVIKSFTINGVDQQTESALRALWPEMLQPGRIYNARLIKAFFDQAQKLLPGVSPEKDFTIKQNSQDDTVDLLLAAGSKEN